MSKRKVSYFKILFLMIAVILITSIVSVSRISYTETVKITPLTLSATGRTAGANVLWNLFDNDTETAFSHVPETSRIVVALEKNYNIKTIRFFGKAAYLANVYWGSPGAWTPISGLTDVDLEKLSDGWNSFDAVDEIITGNMMFELTPLSTEVNIKGVSEVEIWGLNGKKNIPGKEALLGAAESGDMPDNVVLLKASPFEGQVVREETNDNLKFTFNNDRDPRVYKACYLLYESNGLSRWVGTRQSINGTGFTGGFWVGDSDQWTLQVEPVNPLWLRPGENSLTFSAPEDMYGSYAIRDVRFVALMDDGTSFIKEISGPGNPGTLVDEDLSTFWTFSPASGGEDIVDITFKNPIQPHSVSFFLKNSIKGKLDYHYRSAGQWAAPQGGVTNTLNTLQSGWNIIPTLIPDNGTTDGLRLIFTSAGQGGGNIHQLSISGSRAGEREAYRKLVITSPESGEFYGRKAYISGWIEGPDTVNAQIYIAGQKYVRPTGDPENHFGRAVTKDEAGFEGQEDSEPWQVEVKAVYPDGSNVKQIVKLGSYMEEEALPEKETGSASGEEEEKKINSRTIEETDEVEEEVSPGMGKKIGLKGTSLDIPGGAVWKNMKIKIKALKHADLAKLDPGMVNVTAPDYGYRFTPHGTRFRKTVKLKMPYDPYLIPAGMTENDVWTFFYDEKEKSWKKLKRADIDKNAALVESETDHFTDMINAVLVTPEHPEALTYNPNTIKDIKAADPGAGINLIEAPRANNMGDAKLNYPIEIPAGRKGMQPQLSVSYSSSGGNGWLGLGWDLQIPAITVDTRWGVPRYDSAKETETYALNGEMLTPVAHRGELKPRSGEKVFHTRVEGRFREIIRHGNSPDKYWWEVIDKNGTGHFYGGIDGNDASGKLAGDKGIYQWMIRKSIDTNGNTVIYDYSLVCDTGVGGGNNSNGDETCDSGVSGHQIYLKEISYAGFNDTPGKYIVRFVRDNELNEPRRKDISIHGKAGFKIVTADLLRRIEIVLDNQRIRNYVLDYREGVFNKTILSSISQYGEGEKGALFNKHDFDYYDEINLPEKEDPSLLDDKINIETGDDNIAVHLGGKGHEYASAMGGTHAKYNGRHRYRGVSNYLPMKSASQGKKWGTQKTNSTVYLILTDINGDGLADKVFKEGNKYYYRANNLAEDGATTFSGKVELPTLKGLGRQLTEGRSKGDEIYLFYGSFSRYNVKTTSTSMEYFADVNGDNLPDFVKNGVVWFNYLDEDRIPTFTLDSNKTKIPVKQSKIDIEGLIEDQSAFYEEQINNYPLIDPVRRWVAPYDGIVSIGGSVTLIEDTTEDRNAYQTADGVRVAIQHNGSEIWTERIEAQDYSPHNPGGAGSITVKKGDRIYFRVQSVFDGAYDRVTWDPVITYADKPQEALDADNKNIYRFKASEDFLLMGRGGSIPMPFKGKVLITGDLNKADITTDDIRVVVYKNDVPLITKSMSWNETGAVVFNDEVPIGVASTIIYDQSQLNALGIDVASRPDNISDPVDIMDSLRFEIQTDSPIDLTQITWAPVVTYIESNDTNAGSLTDEEGNYIVNMNMPFGVDMYPENGKNTASLPWQVSKEGAFIIYPRLGLITDDPDYLGPLTDVPNSEVAFTVKRRGALVGKSILNIAANKVTEPYLSSIFVPGAGADEELFLDFSSRTPELRAYVQNHAAKIFYVEPATWVSEVAETIKVTPLLKFNLKGNEEAIGSALFMIVKDGEVLHREKLDVSVDKQTPFIAGETVIDTSRGDKIEFYMIITGGNISKFLQQAAISINKNGLLYEKTIPTGAAAETFSAPFNTSIGEAGMFPVAYRGWSYAAYNGNRDRALKPINENDFNISRNNDVNSEEKAYPLIPLQKTHSWGGADEDCRLTNTTMSSTRFGTKYIDVPKSEDFNAYRAVNKIGIAEDYQEGSDTSWYYVPISSGWQSSTGDSHSLLDYMDMNGDHYPDIVSPGGIQYTRADGTLDDKRTNLARLKGIIRKSENDQFNWNIALGGSPGMFGTTSDGTPLSTGAKGGGAKGNTGGGNGGKISGKSGGTGGGGGGKSTGGWIWTAINLAVSFGIGDYSSDGESEVKYDLIDMNGDGLPDKVAQGLKVSLNLGYDFAEPEYWGGVAINESITESDSMSYGFNYMMSAFGEGTSYSDTEGEVEKTLKDINGDGLPDFLFMDGVILVDPDVICDSTNDDGNACDNTYTIYYIKAALNTGAGFGAPVKLIEEDSRISTGLRIESTEGETAGRGLYDTYAVPVINCRDGVCLILHFLIFNQGKDSSESMTKVVNTLVDINGDGLPDHLTSGKDSSMRAHINKTSRTNLLKSVTRPMGASFKIEYKRTGNTYDHPQSKWVMSRLEVSDGFNGDGVDSMVKTIRYENGKYDRLEREFYGFKHVIEEQRDASDMDSLYRSVSREYLNDNFCNKGLLKSEIVRDNLENRFMETVNSYFLYDIDTRAEVNPINIERATVFPKLVRTEKKFYEGQPHFEKETYAAFDYDDYGNVTDFFDAGEPGATDDIVVVIKYEYRPSSYLMSLPQLITVTGGDGKKYRERKGSYDSRGNVTQLVSSISDGQSATIDMTYDDYGNIKTFTGASNEKGDRYQLSYTYDSTVHSYVEKIEDSFNYISTAKYDYRYGKPLSTTDLNGNVISYSYDAFGRTKQIYGPYDQGSHVPTLSFEYHPEVVPARALTKNKEHWDSSETIDTLIYTDGLKRVLQTKKEAEVRKVYGMTISGKAIYDAFGRVIQQGQPVFEAGYQTAFNIQGEPKNPTLFEYDVLDRQTRITLPDNSFSTIVYGFEDNLFMTKVTDGEGKIKNSLKDLRDGIRTMKEKLGNGWIITKYIYNPISEIIEIIDDRDNHTYVTYDMLGRRLSIDNPDTGNVEYKYDEAGNLTGKITPNLRADSKSIKYIYDYNRL
ncbi:MAG: hypothetical protein OEV42_20680, partial [Deltaproteobacteria bacterium]|nr:hypothetical protein [Deltaproteobacteria bacterium]